MINPLIMWGRILHISRKEVEHQDDLLLETKNSSRPEGGLSRKRNSFPMKKGGLPEQAHLARRKLSQEETGKTVAFMKNGEPFTESGKLRVIEELKKRKAKTGKDYYRGIQIRLEGHAEG